MNYKNIKIELPQAVEVILENLKKHNFEGFVVGGCVRDSLLNKPINDWDICTNADPYEVLDIFKKLGYKTLEVGREYGTVVVVINKEEFEITTYRIDKSYNDNRHPSEVSFTRSLKEDLTRRDFTINSLAYNKERGLVDYFNGVQDLNKGIIRCVGNPKDRFAEDSLRMLRAIRFSTKLNFHIEINTLNAMQDGNVYNISKERIAKEFSKILVDKNCIKGIRLLVSTNIAKCIIPELYNTIGFEQFNKHHSKDVYEHILSVVENVPNDLVLRLAALLHDIGKPKCFTKDINGTGHFYGHEKVSANMSKVILKRLAFDNKTTDKVYTLVLNHMINNQQDSLKPSTIKKFINRVGVENLDSLFQLQLADSKGCKNGDVDSYECILALQQKCNDILQQKQPLQVKDLAINGRDLIKLGYKGKEIGDKLKQLLEIVLENPSLNTKEYLLKQ